MPLGMVDSFAATLHAALHGGPADNGAEANGHRSKFVAAGDVVGEDAAARQPALDADLRHAP